MNHHTRSFSAHHPSSQVNTTPMITQPESFIRIHSDSQQSLDQLFNPTQSTAKPLRQRNLPASFFKQSLPEDEPTSNVSNGNRTPNIQPNNFHTRSISFDHRQASYPTRPNFHVRTQSTLAPMPQVLSNDSSSQSSREILNAESNGAVNNRANVGCNHHNQDHNHPQHLHNTHHHHHHHRNSSHLSNGWSSVGNSTDNLSSINNSSSNNWVAGQPQSPVAMIVQQPAAPIQPTQQVPVPSQQAAFVASAESTPMQTNEDQNFFSSTDINHNHINHNQNHFCSNNLHVRSMSYAHPPTEGPRSINTHVGLHNRTHSTIAPMQATPAQGPAPLSMNSHSSSHQSSHEIWNTTSSTNHSNSNGWSSSGYSTDDLNNCWSNNAPSAQPFTQQVPCVAQQQTNVPAPATVVVHSHQQQTVIHQHHSHIHDPHQHQNHHNHAHIAHSHPHHHHHHHEHTPMQQTEMPIHHGHHPNHHHPHHHHHHHHHAPQHVSYNA